MSAKTSSDADPMHDEESGSVTEVGSQAVWSLSSCKPGNISMKKIMNDKQ